MKVKTIGQKMKKNNKKTNNSSRPYVLGLMQPEAQKFFRHKYIEFYFYSLLVTTQ